MGQLPVRKFAKGTRLDSRSRNGGDELPPRQEARPPEPVVGTRHLCMQGLRVLYEYQGRTAEWARLVEEIRHDYCTATTDRSGPRR